MRSSLAHQIWQIQKPVRSYRDGVRFLIHEVIGVYIHKLGGLLLGVAEVVSEPLERKSRALGDAHYMPASRNSGAAGVHSSELIVHHRGGMSEYYARGAYCRERLSVLDYACSDSGGGIVARSAYDGSALAQTGELSHLLGESSCYLAGLIHLAQHRLVETQALYYLVRPVSFGDIKKLHAGSVRNLGGIFVCQDKPDIVLWQKNMTASLVILGLIVLYPKYLGSRPAGKSGVSSDLDELLPAQNLVHLVYLVSCSLVAPDY